ncbi:hypothetical protein ADK57_17165 [Streptomyces sp. MMG1533]|uniref:hypothetical protein n=1 Tax=Streptomyces sp. MMG1533 TaxID=1415546 RepID=UPI0006AE395E|nr:hypothetical protein [Streptomyces sp. MMG1533]KOU67304.1 hypothetical protein ADK57_17165 [Streptomyces sp. MMG1533]
MADPRDYDAAIPHVQEHLDRYLRVFTEVRRTHAGRPPEEVRQALVGRFGDEGLTVWNEVVEDAARRIALDE